MNAETVITEFNKLRSDSRDRVMELVHELGLKHGLSQAPRPLASQFTSDRFISLAKTRRIVRRLPPSELGKIATLVRQLIEDRNVSTLREAPVPYAAGLPRVRYADDAAFRKAVDHVFTEHRELLRLLAQ